MPGGFLKIRVDEASEARWRAAAGGDGKLSGWLRNVADMAAARSTDPAEIRDALVGLRADLNRGIGNNLNQIAHALNADLLAGQQPSASAVEAALTQAAEDLATMRSTLQSALDGYPRRRPRRPVIPQSPDPVIPVSRDTGMPSSEDTGTA